MRKDLEVIKNAIEDKKGTDITIIDLEKLSSIADYFVVCTGNSDTNIKAIADGIDKDMAEAGYNRRGIEGYDEATWILLDFGDTIVHIFNSETRGFYNIEQLWSHAQVVFRS